MPRRSDPGRAVGTPAALAAAAHAALLGFGVATHAWGALAIHLGVRSTAARTALVGMALTWFGSLLLRRRRERLEDEADTAPRPADGLTARATVPPIAESGRRRATAIWVGFAAVGLASAAMAAMRTSVEGGLPWNAALAAGLSAAWLRAWVQFVATLTATALAYLWSDSLRSVVWRLSHGRSERRRRGGNP